MFVPHRLLRVAVLCSERAPGLLYLLNRTPDRGITFEIACVVSSERTFAEEVRVERRGVPTLPHPIHEFYAAREASLFRDPMIRAGYDRETAAMLEPYMPNLVLLDGYRYLVTEPLLAAFPSRVISFQPGVDVSPAAVQLVNARAADARTVVRASRPWSPDDSDCGRLIGAALRLIYSGAVDLCELARTNPPPPPWQLDAGGDFHVPQAAAELAAT